MSAFIWLTIMTALRILGRNRLRAGLTMLGIAWGIVTIVLLMAYGEGFQRALMRGFRNAFSQGTVLAADWLGKQKTIWQIVLASYLLVMNAAVHEPAMAWVRPLFDSPAVGRRIMVPILLTITLVITVWSGAAYVWKNRRLVLDQR